MLSFYLGKELHQVVRTLGHDDQETHQYRTSVSD